MSTYEIEYKFIFSDLHWLTPTQRRRKEATCMRVTGSKLMYFQSESAAVRVQNFFASNHWVKCEPWLGGWRVVVHAV